MAPELWAYIFFVSVILLFAIISNILVITIIFRFKKLRTATHVLICNLAVSDILLGALFMPQVLHDMSHPQHYHEGDILCKFIHGFPILVITGSSYTLVFISYERRRAILESHKPQMTLNQVIKLFPVIWFISLVVAFPTMFEYSVHTTARFNTSGNNSISDDKVCGNSSSSHALTIVNCLLVLIFTFIIPLACMCSNYGRLILFINKRCSTVFVIPGRTEHTDSHKGMENTHLYKNRIKIVKMLVIMTVTFIICWLPFLLLYMYTKLSGQDASLHSSSYAILVLNVLMAISTAYNVILYVIFNSTFRQAFKNMLRCSWSEMSSTINAHRTRSVRNES